MFTVELYRLYAHAPIEHGFVDVVTAAFACNQISFINQLLVGENYGIACDA